LRAASWQEYNEETLRSNVMEHMTEPDWALRSLQAGEIRGLDLTLKDALQYKYISSAMMAKDVA
jgi:hypothetical protein